MAAKKTGSKKGTSARARSTGFLHPYAHYVEEYGQSERSVKRWVSVGRKVDDPPPLDEPGQMANWWSRHFKQRVPDRILKMAKASPVDGDESVKGDPLFSQPEEGEKKVVPFVVPDNLAVGLEASVDRLRHAEAVANAKFTHNVTQGADDGEIERSQRAWERISNQLRQQEKALRELDGKYGASYSEKDVVEVINKYHMPIYMGIMNLVRKVSPRIDMIEDPVEKQQVWLAEVKKLWRGFEESGFSAPVEEFAIGE